MLKMLRSPDLGVGIYLLAAILFFIIPIPSILLDVMLAVNIGIALVILFNVLDKCEDESCDGKPFWILKANREFFRPCLDD